MQIPPEPLCRNNTGEFCLWNTKGMDRERQNDNVLTLLNTRLLTKQIVAQHVKNSRQHINHKLHSRLYNNLMSESILSQPNVVQTLTDSLRSNRVMVFFSKVRPRFLKRPPPLWCSKYKVSFYAAYFYKFPRVNSPPPQKNYNLNTLIH